MSACGSQPGGFPTGQEPITLYVDLDGTLIRTDIFWESLRFVVRRRPSALLLTPLWLLKGKAHLKYELAKRTQIDVETLPYCQEVIARIRRRREAGGHVVLATAAAEPIAQAIADYLSIFDGVLATRNGANLKERVKLDAIRAASDSRGFEYWGDSADDLPVFAAARASLLVRPKIQVKRRAVAQSSLIEILDCADRQRNCSCSFQRPPRTP
jgi:phosphoserine phosphatase